MTSSTESDLFSRYFGLKPLSAATLKTAARVSGLTLAGLLDRRETVAVETLARRAICRTVTLLVFFNNLHLQIIPANNSLKQFHKSV